MANDKISWAPTIPLISNQLPKITADMMPDVLADMAVAVANATETPLELAAALALPSVATACQGKFMIEPEPGYKEPLCIWVIAPMEPGNRKSAVLRLMISPLVMWEQQKA